MNATAGLAALSIANNSFNKDSDSSYYKRESHPKEAVSHDPSSLCAQAQIREQNLRLSNRKKQLEAEQAAKDAQMFERLVAKAPKDFPNEEAAPPQPNTVVLNNSFNFAFNPENRDGKIFHAICRKERQDWKQCFSFNPLAYSNDKLYKLCKKMRKLGLVSYHRHGAKTLVVRPTQVGKIIYQSIINKETM